MRAALNAYRIPMMELLVSHGADVNAMWHGHFPVIFAPCESLDPATLKWLLDHGSNPNCGGHGYEIGGHPYPGTALDYLIASYARSLERLSACIDVLLEAGGETRYDTPAVLALLRGRPSPRVAQTNPVLRSIVLITESIFPLKTCLARLRVKPPTVWNGKCDGNDSA
jgi:hypothetical protein